MRIDSVNPSLVKGGAGEAEIAEALLARVLLGQQEILEARQHQAVQPDQTVFTVDMSPVSSLNLGDNPADIMAKFGASLEFSAVSEVHAVTLDGRFAARIDFADSALHSEGFLIGFLTGKDTFFLVGAITYQGDLAANEALLLEMAAQVVNNRHFI